MENTVSNYEKNCQEWQARFRAMDQERLLEIIPGLKREGRDLTLYHFGEKFAVDAATGAIRSLESEEPVSATVRLNIYTLFGYASPLARFQDDWVPFQQLRDTSVFQTAFQNGIVTPFVATFTGHTHQLRRALEAMGGREVPWGDVGYQVEAFACIPVRFLFWEGDEEFPAQANLLFDRSATDYIHGESIVTLAAVGVHRLAKLAGLPLDRRAFPLS